jgi:asparagine synthase (glutamine-hydrolysing)
MCGIFGISLANTLVSKKLFAESLDLINHRGPDMTGISHDESENIAFGHKRLSIIDLSDLGSQPMNTPNSSYQIIFNGEIYNFKEIRNDLEKLNYSFISQTDTEVLLNSYAEWGPDCVKRFKGMFAFAIYDQKQKTIFLSRDRAGEKPLYYSIHNGNLFFCSEIKPILNFEKNLNIIDSEAFSYLFEHGFTQRDKSIFKNIYKLKAGHSLTFNIQDRGHEIHNYWSLPNKINECHANKSHVNESDLLPALENYMEQAVKSQLDADVPIGIMLSGGLDSSLITAFASRFKEKINTFTVSFSGHGAFDETSHAKLIADAFQTNHYELEARAINPQIIEELTYYYDDPMFDPSMIPTYLLSEAISKNFKVALSGDGGDELFGGYNHYSKLARLKKFSNLVPYFFRQSLNNLSQNVLPLGFRGRKTVELLSSNFIDSYPNTNEFFSDKEQEIFFSNFFANKAIPSPERTHDQSNIISDYGLRATFHDFTNYLSEDLLVKIDRASMANGIEVRAPFLDKDLVEFAFTKVPSSLKFDCKNRKILLKKLALKVLPSSFEMHRKQGFSIPLGNFLLEKEWSEYFAQTILDSDPLLINRKDSMALLEDKARIFQNAGRLFGLVFYIHWMKRFKPIF